MHRRAYIFLLITTLLWGGNSVAGKLAVDHVSPMTLVFLRWVLAVAILLPIGWRTIQEDWPVVRRHWLILAALGASGFTLVYVLQEKPRLMELKFRGNKKFSDSKLRKKLSTKINEPLDERKLFTDTQDIQQMYQKAGYPKTDVKYEPVIEEAAGRATVTFVITESPKVKIVEVDFVGATAFKQKKLRKVVKTRKRWMLSWITQSGYFKDDVLEEDKEKLVEYYHDHGYIDFDIKDIQIANPTPRSMIIRFIIYEGAQYKVGSVKFTGNKLFTTNDIAKGMRVLHDLARVSCYGIHLSRGGRWIPGILWSAFFTFPRDHAKPRTGAAARFVASVE